MFAYALRRLLISIPILLVFSFVMYIVLYQAADPTARLRQIPGLRAADLQRIIEQQGLNDPWYTGYVNWLKDFVKGDWGVSASNRASDAASLVFGHMPATLQLMVGALVVSTLIAAPLGVYSAVRRYSGFDYAGTAFAYIGYAIPTFLLGLLLQLFAIWTKDNGWAIIPFLIGVGLMLAGIFRLREGLGPRITTGVGAVLVVLAVVFWGSLGGHGNLFFYTAQSQGAFLSPEWFRHYTLPLITLSVVSIAGWSRFQRSATLEVLNADYLRTARAKGLSERSVVGRHALRNALLPLITIMAIDIGAVFTGAVITETVFAWPGIGTLFFDAAQNRDIPVAMGVLMFGAVMIIVFNLIADIAYAVADPRIRLS
jgi:peptide/nickel transport system permease protein